MASKHIPMMFRDIADEFPCSHGSNMSIYVDQAYIVVEAALPGIPSQDINLTFDRGYLIIDGERQEEEGDKLRRYYRRSSQSFFYRVEIPSRFDKAKEPEVSFKDGIIKVKFHKLNKTPNSSNKNNKQG